MDTKNFKNITGEIKEGEIATIRLFGTITEEHARGFNNEFDYLECCVKPKLIRVLINSEGGSVLHGMTIYSTIQNSTVPTETIIEGMAASMASIVWAAGSKSLMRDYSILMIHNPFLPADESAKSSDLVEAFTKQITTIYRKRFGLKKEHVESIMNGEAGKDGTFFDAESAVKAGIIPPENVLRTSKQICDKVKNEVLILENVTEIQALMSKISMEAGPLDTENKPFPNQSPNLKQKPNNHSQMNEEKNISPEYAAVAATLGLKEGFEIKDLIARVSALVGVETKLTETTKALGDAQTVIAGRDATIQNLQKNNDDLAASLKIFQDKEAAEVKASIENLVDTAITDGRIDKSTKEQWIQMAEANFTLAETTLNSIPVPEQITKEIASDPKNVQAAADATQTVEEKIAEQVKAVVGEKFEFKKMNG
ncbi:MAG: ATP-dependent Clp protease proteolytic subunit [Candidatus Ordinivivax streblomastigis]|uniref:ATP-dependent Clp protease proteolytic subunit n=1 Tax=Candidatus Ordinivivax streblomastigis TaxID=2540710 RepID=A0A5M8P368_9BACT|nr:MAG: ATP-dependent Clp protease proteolytic subunit [Candidatus Ordinivivax streblomastigis]